MRCLSFFAAVVLCNSVLGAAEGVIYSVYPSAKKPIGAERTAFVDEKKSWLTDIKDRNLYKYLKMHEYVQEGLIPFFSEEKWGYLNEAGKLEIQPTYDKAYVFSEGVARVENGNKTGYILISGGIFIKAIYESGSDFKHGNVVVKVGDKFGVIDKNGKVIVKPMYSEIKRLTIDSFLIKNEKWGVISSNGNYIIKEVYDELIPADENILFGMVEGSRVLIDYDGKIKEIKEYIRTEKFSEGMAVFSKNGENEEKFGYIDLTGKVALEAIYDSADNFSGGRALVGNINDAGDMKYGYIGPNGKSEKGFIYTSASNFSNGIAAVSRGGRYYFIDRFENAISEALFDKVSELGLGEFEIERDGKIGVVNKTNITGKGKIAVGIPQIWNKTVKENESTHLDSEKDSNLKNIKRFKINDYFAVNKMNQRYFITDGNGNGNFIEGYDLVSVLENGAAIVEIEGKYGFVDETGKALCGIVFDKVKPFSEGAAAVKYGGKWGYLDKNGEIILELKYDEAYPFEKGKAKVKEGENYKFIDRGGN